VVDFETAVEANEIETPDMSENAARKTHLSADPIADREDAISPCLASNV